MDQGRLLDDLERLLARGLREDARRGGVSEATARVLLALDVREEVPMGEMAHRVGRDPSTTTRFVDRAAAAGLLRREAGLDRRRRLVLLTKEGRQTRERLQQLRAARARSLPAGMQTRTGLGAEEVEWFLEALVEALRPERP